MVRVFISPQSSSRALGRFSRDWRGRSWSGESLQAASPRCLWPIAAGQWGRAWEPRRERGWEDDWALSVEARAAKTCPDLVRTVRTAPGLPPRPPGKRRKGREVERSPARRKPRLGLQAAPHLEPSFALGPLRRAGALPCRNAQRAHRSQRQRPRLESQPPIGWASVASGRRLPRHDSSLRSGPWFWQARSGRLGGRLPGGGGWLAGPRL